MGKIPTAILIVLAIRAIERWRTRCVICKILYIGGACLLLSLWGCFRNIPRRRCLRRGQGAIFADVFIPGSDIPVCDAFGYVFRSGPLSSARTALACDGRPAERVVCAADVLFFGADISVCVADVSYSASGFYVFGAGGYRFDVGVIAPGLRARPLLAQFPMPQNAVRSILWAGSEICKIW